MPDPGLLQQTQHSLAALREFAATTHNAQLLDHLARLEASLAALTAAGVVASGDIAVGDISASSAIRIGHDINITVNQFWPAPLKQPWEAVQNQWGAAHSEIRKLNERGPDQHIFLSYSREDAKTAFHIRRALEDAGHRVWQDLVTIQSDEPWLEAIKFGVDHSYRVIIVISTQWQQDRWVQKEYSYAHLRNKPIIVVQLDAGAIPTEMLGLPRATAYPELASGLGQVLALLPPLPIPPPPLESRRDLERRYLDGLLWQHSVWQEVYTPMAGMGQLRQSTKPAASTQMQMKTTPTKIDVSYLVEKIRPKNLALPEPAEPKAYEADILPAVDEMRRLVILGDPGAGKTTTLWKILSDYALRAKDDPRAPLPVLVPLGAWHGDDASGDDSSGEHWPTMLASQLGPLGAHYAALLGEKRLVFLLDGLNELPVAHRDAHLAELRQWLAHCQRADLIVAVTCRELDYTGALDLNLPGRVTITPLDPVRIQRFVNAYIEEPPGKGDELFWQLAGAEAKQQWEAFSKKVGEAQEIFWLAESLPEDKTWWRWEDWVRARKHPRSMLGLASNPYMLYMMTQVFARVGELPRNRGALFQEFIDHLLEHREHLAPEAAATVKHRLAALAYALQRAGAGTTFSIAQAMEYLEPRPDRWADNAPEINASPHRPPVRSYQILYHARSANLLSGGDDARFTHQLLQEYFAAHHLQTLMATTPATALFPADKFWEPQGWEETLILLAGLYTDDCSPVVNWLKDAQPDVAARCIVESGAHCPDSTLEQLRAQWTPRLTDLKRDPEPKARAAIGRALGRLRLGGLPLDNRQGVALTPSPSPTGRGVGVRVLPDIDWVEIPGGPFVYQDGEKRTEPTFYLARYPITYAQFQTFLDDPQGFAGYRCTRLF